MGETTVERIIEVVENNELVLRGICSTKEREGVVEQVIKMLQEDPEKALKHNYMGMKNYAGFGDQGISPGYGTGPRHGVVVFSIGRGYTYDPAKAEDYIHVLLALRDFPGMNITDRGREEKLDLSETVRLYGDSTRKMKKCSEALALIGHFKG